MSQVRVADYIAQTLLRHGIRHVFLITGGGAMHLNDAIGRCKGLEYVCCHHEQACTMAADSYFRLSGRLAAVNVTSGPGGTNAITGVYGAWVDSLGMIVISGNVKWETLVRSTALPLRQLGDQEIDITRLVAPITKYAEMITDPLKVRYHLERALYIATSGRPGPVWLDVPMNVQGAQVDSQALVPYSPEADQPTFATGDLGLACQRAMERLHQSKRPVVLAGSGVRISGAHELFLRLVEKLGVPVVSGWNAHDVIWNDHPLFVGRPGTVGDRAGNFAVQNADFVLVLGCRLNIRQVSYAWKNFAKRAFKVMVDIDENELKKPTLSIDQPIHADLKEALPRLLASASGPTDRHSAFLKWCHGRRGRYPVVLPEYWASKEKVNPYCFMDTLFKELPENEVVVSANGSACVTSFQAAVLKRHQRLYTNSGCASMGYELPAAVGASLAQGRKRVICLAGDGSIQMNLQEMQTIATLRLPIKIFVLNNDGYHSIRQTQRSFFPDNFVGMDPSSGVALPDFQRLAQAYGFPYRRIGTHAELTDRIRETLEQDGPQVCEVMLDISQDFAPKLASRRLPDGTMQSPSLEDMAPFLDADELLENTLEED